MLFKDLTSWISFFWGIAGNWKYRIGSRRIDSRERGAIGACGCLHCIITRSGGISPIWYDMEVVAVSQERQRSS